jgi:hypothetical protein
VRWYVPAVPEAGRPARVAVPLPLSLKLTPEGSAPVSLMAVAAGYPAVVLTVKEPDRPVVNVAWSALVMVGDSSTNRVKDWLTLTLVSVVATRVSACEPSLPAGGVPFSDPVPFPLSTSVSQLGRDVAVRVTEVDADVWTEKEPATPTWNRVELPLVNVKGEVALAVGESRTSWLRMSRSATSVAPLTRRMCFGRNDVDMTSPLKPM